MWHHNCNHSNSVMWYWKECKSNASFSSIHKEQEFLVVTKHSQINTKNGMPWQNHKRKLKKYIFLTRCRIICPWQSPIRSGYTTSSAQLSFNWTASCLFASCMMKHSVGVCISSTCDDEIHGRMNVLKPQWLSWILQVVPIDPWSLFD